VAVWGGSGIVFPVILTQALQAAATSAHSTRQQGSPKRGSFGRVDRYQFSFQHRGQDLPLQGAFCPAAGGAYLADFAQAGLLDQGQTVLQAEGDALQQGARQVTTSVAKGQANPCAARQRVRMRGPFTAQVGKELQPLAPPLKRRATTPSGPARTTAVWGSGACAAWMRPKRPHPVH
jgi:hypothetical protein